MKLLRFSGLVDDDCDLTLKRDWFKYWRELFPGLTTQRIDAFEQEYKG